MNALDYKNRTQPVTSNLIWDLLRGHVLNFDRPQINPWPPILILQSVLAVSMIEIIVRPLLIRTVAARATIGASAWQLVFLLLLFAAIWLAVYIIPALRMVDVGIRGLRSWSRGELAYFLQVIVLALLVFGSIHAPALRTLVQAPDTASQLLFAVFPNFMWGYWQEWLYRGMLQSALVRRWGSVAGVCIASAVFTLGPLHAYHFFTPDRSLLQRTLMFGSIFVVGLFFGTLFHRSGNLTLVGIFHGIGNAFMQGLPVSE